MGGQRGKLILQKERVQAIKLIDEAYAAGARKSCACELLNISLRTLERWKNNRVSDRRKGATKSVANKLPQATKEEIINIANSKEYRDLAPCKIVPLLADKNIYIASESSFYRVLRKEKQLEHRRGSTVAPNFNA